MLIVLYVNLNYLKNIRRVILESILHLVFPIISFFRFNLF